MNDEKISIPVPVSPLDEHLPRSDIRFALSPGCVVELLNIPAQGVRTIRNLQATLSLWRPNIVRPELDYQI